MEKDEIKERLSEYIQKLCGSNRDETLTTLEFNNEGLEIMNEKVQYSLKKMKLGTAAAPTGISVEMITGLENVGIETITSLLKIYNTGNIPGDQISIHALLFHRSQDQQNARNIRW